jgi:hypothetical protein
MEELSVMDPFFLFVFSRIPVVIFTELIFHIIQFGESGNKIVFLIMCYLSIGEQQRAGFTLQHCKTSPNILSPMQGKCKASARQIWESGQSLGSKNGLFVFYAEGAIKTVTYLMRPHSGYISLHKTFYSA